MANFYFVEEMNNEKARDYLLDRLFYARNSANVIGGYEGWLKALNLYYAEEWLELFNFIVSCHGRCGTRRQEMLICINIIIQEESK